MPQPPTFRKVNPADLPIMFISMSSEYDNRTALDEYAETLLARQLSTIDGVAQVAVFGNSKYAVRIQADPDALAARQIGIDTLANAVAAANVNQATGALNGAAQSAIIHTNGQLNNAAQFSDQVIAYRNGAPVRLRDVAKVIDGLENPLWRKLVQKSVAPSGWRSSASPAPTRWASSTPSRRSCPSSRKACRRPSSWK